MSFACEPLCVFSVRSPPALGAHFYAPSIEAAFVPFSCTPPVLLLLSFSGRYWSLSFSSFHCPSYDPEKLSLMGSASFFFLFSVLFFSLASSSCPILYAFLPPSPSSSSPSSSSSRQSHTGCTCCYSCPSVYNNFSHSLLVPVFHCAVPERSFPLLVFPLTGRQICSFYLRNLFTRKNLRLKLSHASGSDLLLCPSL